MFLVYVLVGVLLGVALIAVVNTNNPQCTIVFTGHSTTIQGCERLTNLHDIIAAVNNRLSFSSNCEN